jgi:hypothetical protein
MHFNSRKKGSKIPKKLSESVNRRRTDNTMAKRQRANNDLQNTTQKTKDRATRTSLKPGGEPRCLGKVSRSCPASDTVVLL